MVFALSTVSLTNIVDPSEVNIIAQAFVGFCAKMLSWAHDLGRRKREVLATTVLDRVVELLLGQLLKTDDDGGNVSG